MKISTKGRYALRCMLDLAINSKGNYVKLNQIATRQNISEKYLEQIIASLYKAEFVVSNRGAQGGYKLTKDPEEITVGMVLRAIEGSLAPVECLEENALPCLRKDICTTVKVWQELYEAINNVVDKYTLAMLVEMDKGNGEFII